MRRLLGQALHPSQRLHSGQVTVSISQTGPAATSVRLAGSFQALGAGHLPRFDIDASLFRGASTQAIGATSTGDRLFVRAGGASYLAPTQLLGELQQSYAQGARPGSTPATLGLDPGRWLTHPVRVGTVVLAGVRTVHIRAALDAGRLNADLHRLQIRIGALAALAGAVNAIPGAPATGGRADVYVGAADHLLRELWVRTSGAEPIAAVLSFARLNQPQPIRAPARARPFSGLISALGHGRR